MSITDESPAVAANIRVLNAMLEEVVKALSEEMPQEERFGGVEVVLREYPFDEEPRVVRSKKAYVGSVVGADYLFIEVVDEDDE